MPRLRQWILRMVACCAALLLTLTTCSTFATAGEDRAQQKHQDFSMMACLILIQKNSLHLKTARQTREVALQVSPQAITQAATVPAGARATRDSSVGVSRPSISSAQGAGGFCEAYKGKHANGSTVWCSVRPA
jgi:Na+/melibiose symporter-like transporter